jgi:hypothetical protein
MIHPPSSPASGSQVSTLLRLDSASKSSPNRLAIFTACSANYLNKAMAMCMSALDHEPDANLVILLVDTKRHVELKDSRVSILWAEDLGFEGYLQCAFKYNIIELNTALKPFAALRLLDMFERVIYLDPDICVYAPLTSVHEALSTSSVALTPHALSPYAGNGRPNDQDSLRFGAYNLGFFAVKADPNGRALMHWWDKQCRDRCFYEPQSGLGVDQKWMDLAPSFFEGVRILRDPGLNVAFWNLHERHLDHVNGHWRVNGEDLLRFVHFSSFVQADQGAIAGKQTRYEPGSRQDFTDAAQTYRAYLEASRDAATMEHEEYGYAYFSNGQPISPALRRFYAISRQPDVIGAANPFSSDVVYRFAKINGLLTKGAATIGQLTFKAQSDYSRQQAAISWLFRAALRVLGADRYFMLLRYLSTYTSILNQTDIGQVFDQRVRT